MPINHNNTVLNPIDVVVSLRNGVYYKRTGAGDGTMLASGDSITIDYSGTLLDNSSFDDLNGFKYKHGSGGVISGLDIGVKEMEQNEEALIFISSAQAYGASVRVIPASSIDDLITQFVVSEYVAKVRPYEVLVFDVTLQTIHYTTLYVQIGINPLNISIFDKNREFETFAHHSLPAKYIPNDGTKSGCVRKVQYLQKSGQTHPE